MRTTITSQTQATCGFVDGNPYPSVQCYNGGYCSSSGYINAAGCCVNSGSTTSCDYSIACLDYLSALNLCPQGGCPSVGGKMTCVGQNGKSVCETYISSAFGIRYATFGCGRTGGEYYLKQVSTTVTVTFTVIAVSTSGVEATQTPESSTRSSLTQGLTTTSHSKAASPATSTQSITKSSTGTKLPIIISVTTILGCLAFLAAFWLLFVRQKRRQRGGLRASVKFNDLLERKRRAQAQVSSIGPGLRQMNVKQTTGGEKTNKNDSDGRWELPA